MYVRSGIGVALLPPELVPMLSTNSTSTTDSAAAFTIPLFVVILIAFGGLVIVTYSYCFFCVPSTNKRKIYAMMKEAKLEDEGHH
jgi:hypothetical protein